MNDTYFKFAFLALVVLTLGGCFSSVPETRYYLLEYVPTPKAERLQRGAYPYRVRMREFTVAEAYRREQIVYRQSAHELRFYNYELWAVKPERLVGDMVFRHLQDSKLFLEVTRTIEEDQPDFILKGEISALEEYDNKDQWFAHLAITLILQDPHTQEIVWSHPFDYRKKVERTEPVYVVRELSFLLETCMEQSVAELESVLSGWQKNGRPKVLPKAPLGEEPATPSPIYEIRQDSVSPPLNGFPPPPDTALPLPEGVPAK